MRIFEHQAACGMLNSSVADRGSHSASRHAFADVVPCKIKSSARCAELFPNELCCCRSVPRAGIGAAAHIHVVAAVRPLLAAPVHAVGAARCGADAAMADKVTGNAADQSTFQASGFRRSAEGKRSKTHRRGGCSDNSHVGNLPLCSRRPENGCLRLRLHRSSSTLIRRSAAKKGTKDVVGYFRQSKARETMR